MKIPKLCLIIVVILDGAFGVAQPLQENLHQTVEPIYGSAEVTSIPKVLSKPEPSYTESARKKGIEGVVILRAVFASSGKMTNIKTVQGLPDGLTEKAIEAASKIKFKPAVKDGKAVSFRIQLVYYFDLSYSASAVTKQPEPSENLQVSYTEEAINKKVKGTVVLRVSLSKEGVVRSVNVVKGLPHGLTENVVATIRRTKFKPAEVDGRPVAWVGKISYTFR